MLSFFLFRFFGSSSCAIFCRSPFLRGCLVMSYGEISFGTSPSFLVLSWLCLGFFHMMVAGKKLPSQDVLLRLSYWSKRSSFIFRFRGTDLICNPSHSGCVSDAFCRRASLSMYFLFPSLRKPRRFVWFQCDSWP